MISTPTLVMPNFDAPFVIESDASSNGIGAVLTQQGRPIPFMSRALGVTKKSCLPMQKKCLPLFKLFELGVHTG